MRRSILLFGIALLGLLVARDAAAMRCGNQLVDEGDYAYEVRRACGEPDAVQPLGGPFADIYGSDEEIWYYDFGDARFVRVLHFRNGRLQRIETSDRGLGPGEATGHCRPNDIVPGMTSYRLLLVCGVPVQQDRRYVRRTPDPRRFPHLVEDVLVEQWIYEFGGGYLPRLVRVEDGKVVSVDVRP